MNLQIRENSRIDGAPPGGGRKLLRLGDAIKALTSLFRIPPCAACEKRAAKLNAVALPLGRMTAKQSDPEKDDGLTR
jgi:hypothetical protein